MKRRLRIPLSGKGIDRAIREIEAYKREIAQKTEALRALVAENVRYSAERGFSSASGDRRIGEPSPAPDVRVTLTERGGISVILAAGEDAVFVEFGAGVSLNGPVGSSPHPLGVSHGFTVGSYGKGYGARKVWGFVTEDGSLHLTRGTPAAMPMYRAALETAGIIPALAKEVFG